MADTLALELDRIIDIASGKEGVNAADVEHRSTRRCDFDAPMALVQWTPEAGKTIAAVVCGRNISSTGMCVESRYMLHVGQEGVVLMLRSSGEPALLGVRVVHSRYAGEMKHESGLTFIELPEGFTLEDFRNEQGNLPDFVAKKAA